jgi:hypothetical protein
LTERRKAKQHGLLNRAFCPVFLLNIPAKTRVLVYTKSDNKKKPGIPMPPRRTSRVQSNLNFIDCAPSGRRPFPAEAQAARSQAGTGLFAPLYYFGYMEFPALPAILKVSPGGRRRRMATAGRGAGT